tara:strand:- start:93 stop:638 length:546 start_codon:yes stop_codon:yes gene_type:complete
MGLSKEKKIGIFGGSFDPPHKGHLIIAKQVIKKIKLNKLFWLVAKKNPFKKVAHLNLNKRIELSKNLVKSEKKIIVKFLDNRMKSSRTINNIMYLIRKNKNSKFFLIIGSDNLINFHKWKSWKKIIKVTTLVVYPRNKFQNKAKKSIISRYLSKKNVIFIKSKKIDISSSKLRKNYLKLVS